MVVHEGENTTYTVFSLLWIYVWVWMDRQRKKGWSKEGEEERKGPYEERGAILHLFEDVLLPHELLSFPVGLVDHDLQHVLPTVGDVHHKIHQVLKKLCDCSVLIDQEREEIIRRGGLKDRQTEKKERERRTKKKEEQVYVCVSGDCMLERRSDTQSWSSMPGGFFLTKAP